MLALLTILISPEISYALSGDDSMAERRTLYTGDESAEKGLNILQLSATGALILTAIFNLLFDRAKHIPGLASVNPFAEDPFDAVGSFGIQLGAACAMIAALRAFRTNLKTESLYNRYTYTLRAIGASMLAIIVTMLADLGALLRYPSLWQGTSGGNLLLGFTSGLLLLASGFCAYLIGLANRRSVCSKNPLRTRQIVPFLILLCLLVIYPGSWRDGTAGGILTAAVGLTFLFVSVALLSKAMFPCPDIPERDLIDDLNLTKIPEVLNPRKHEWTLVVIVALLLGILFASIEIFGEGLSRDAGRRLLVPLVFISMESAGVILGYALFRRFLGLVRST
jgi:hypothetical protein